MPATPCRRMLHALLLLFAVTITVAHPQALLAASGTPGTDVGIELSVGNNRAWVNGVETVLDVPPFIERGRLLVPLRFVGEALGASVRWDAGNIRLEMPGRTVTLHVGRNVAEVNGVPITLDVPPRVHQGRTMVPLRFVAESFGIPVHYDGATGRVRLGAVTAAPVARIQVDRTTIRLGEPLHYQDASTAPEGRVIVRREWSNEPPWPAPGVYRLTLRVQDDRGVWSAPAVQEIEVLPATARPPVALFHVSKREVAQGETVYYTDLSYDPSGGEIVEREWSGRQDAFFSPGIKTVSLRVRNAAGLWSEPYVQHIHVTSRRLADPFTYAIRHAAPGDVVRADPRQLDILPQAAATWSQEGPVLFFSNNPETVPSPGILYRDALSGPARLYYWHANGSGQPLRFLLLLSNETAQAVPVRVERIATAGPSPYAQHVGRAGVVRYLSWNQGRTLTVPPGGMVILNAPEQHGVVRPGEVIHGIYDVRIDGQLTVAMVAAPAGANPKDFYRSAPVLPREAQHSRGTFPLADRVVSVDLPGDSPARLTLIGRHQFLEGVDATNGQRVSAAGYGAVFRVRVEPRKETALLLRGSGFAGALGLDGGVVPVPAAGQLRGSDQLALGQILDGGRAVEVLFLPPGGSNLPLELFFWPLGTGSDS